MHVWRTEKRLEYFVLFGPFFSFFLGGSFVIGLGCFIFVCVLACHSNVLEDNYMLLVKNIIGKHSHGVIRQAVTLPSPIRSLPPPH